MRKLFIFYFYLVSIQAHGQTTNEHIEFLTSLFWNIPFSTSLTHATKLLNESAVFSEVKIVHGQLQAYASSNPYFKSDSRYANNSTTAIRFRMFFEDNGKSSERRIIISDQKSKQIGYTLVALLKSISYSFKLTEEGKSIKYDFFYKKESKEPFFIIAIKTLYDDNYFDIWLSFIDERWTI